jgi:hypothetical protein
MTSGYVGSLVEKMRREFVGAPFPFGRHQRRDLKSEMSLSHAMVISELWTSVLMGLVCGAIGL